MSFNSSKIVAGDFTSHGIVGKANKLPGPTAENKKAFDELVREVVAVKLNALIDAMQAATAAGEIGFDAVYGLTATNLQDAIAEIMVAMAGITQGTVAPESIETSHLQDEAVTTAKLDDGAVTAAKLDPALTYAAVGLTADQVIPIYIQAGDPASGDPDGIYLVTGS